MATIDNTVIVMASDSASLCDTNVTIMSHDSSKHWDIEIKNLGFGCIGFAGSLAVCNVIKHVFDWPAFSYELQTQENIIRYLTSDAYPEIMLHLIARFKDQEHLKPNLQDWSLLIGLNKKLYVMYQDGFVETSELNFAAIGDGAEIANGVLFSNMYNSNLTSWDKLQLAYEAAAYFKTSVRGPLKMTCCFTNYA